jgi:hypothetical protein
LEGIKVVSYICSSVENLNDVQYACRVEFKARGKL